MNCKKCDVKLTKETRRKSYVGVYKSNICRICYNKKIAVYNKKRAKALKEARWF